jgi:hypothetical protein
LKPMTTPLLPIRLRSAGSSLFLAAALMLPAVLPGFTASAQSAAPAASQSLEYKMISGFKQPFNDDLQLHLSKGWTPVGGVAVTTWNNDLYFAVLLGRPVSR